MFLSTELGLYCFSTRGLLVALVVAWSLGILTLRLVSGPRHPKPPPGAGDGSDPWSASDAQRAADELRERASRLPRGRG